MNDETQTNSEQATSDSRGSEIGVGAMLRASRIRHGQDLRAVAAMLCVRYPYLEAIENGRYDELPGRTYAIGFIRAYADYLGLNSDEVVRRFKDDVATGKVRTELHFPTPVLETSIPSGAIISVGIVIAVIAYGGWYMSTAEEGFIARLIEPLPQRFGALMSSNDEAVVKAEATTATPAATTPESVTVVDAPPPPVEPTPMAEPQPAPKPAPKPAPQRETPVETAAATVEGLPVVEASAAVAAEPVAEPVVETPAAESVTVKPPPIAADPAPEQPSLPVPEPVVEAQQLDPQQITVETLPAPAPEPAAVLPVVETPPPSVSEQAALAPEAAAAPPPLTYREITVRANSDSWFEIKDEFGGASLAARTLRVGEEYRVPNRSGLLLVTGNAGALEILVDGESVPPIGRDGAVLRGVRLDADMLLNGTAVAE